MFQLTLPRPLTIASLEGFYYFFPGSVSHQFEDREEIHEQLNQSLPFFRDQIEYFVGKICMSKNVSEHKRTSLNLIFHIIDISNFNPSLAY